MDARERMAHALDLLDEMEEDLNDRAWGKHKEHIKHENQPTCAFCNLRVALDYRG